MAGSANPYMSVMTQGGQLANQSASVGNSMMSNVQRAMQMTSDLTFKLDKLLKDEQARKWEQGMMTQKFLYQQAQDSIRNAFEKQRIDIQRMNAATSRGHLSLSQKKYDDERKWAEGVSGLFDDSQPGTTPDAVGFLDKVFSGAQQRVDPFGQGTSPQAPVPSSPPSALTTTGSAPAIQPPSAPQVSSLPDYDSYVKQYASSNPSPEAQKILSDPQRFQQLERAIATAPNTRSPAYRRLKSVYDEVKNLDKNAQKSYRQEIQTRKTLIDFNRKALTEAAKGNAQQAYKNVMSIPDEAIDQEFNINYSDALPSVADFKRMDGRIQKLQQIIQTTDDPSVASELQKKVDTMRKEQKRMKMSKPEVQRIQQYISNRVRYGALLPEQEASLYSNYLQGLGITSEMLPSGSDIDSSKSMTEVKDIKRDMETAQAAIGNQTFATDTERAQNAFLVDLYRFLPGGVRKTLNEKIGDSNIPGSSALEYFGLAEDDRLGKEVFDYVMRNPVGREYFNMLALQYAESNGLPRDIDKWNEDQKTAFLLDIPVDPSFIPYDVWAKSEQGRKAIDTLSK